MSDKPTIIIIEKRLSKDILNLLKKDMLLRNKVVAEIGKSPRTFDRWIEGNHENLTTAKCLNAISKYTGIKTAKLTEDYLPDETKK